MCAEAVYDYSWKYDLVFNWFMLNDKSKNLTMSFFRYNKEIFETSGWSKEIKYIWHNNNSRITGVIDYNIFTSLGICLYNDFVKFPLCIFNENTLIDFEEIEKLDADVAFVDGVYVFNACSFEQVRGLIYYFSKTNNIEWIFNKLFHDKKILVKKNSSNINLERIGLSSYNNESIDTELEKYNNSIIYDLHKKTGKKDGTNKRTTICFE